MVDFSAELSLRLRREPDREMIEYKGRHWTRGQVVALGETLTGLLRERGVRRDAFTAIVVRNRPLQAASLLGLITHQLPLRTIYAFQSPEAIARDVTGYAAVIADTQDWYPEVIEAVRATGAIGISLDLNSDSPISLVPGLETLAPGERPTCVGEPVLEMLSSGTTGKPKPIRFDYRLLARAAESAIRGRIDEGVPPDIMVWPFAGIGGICSLTANTMLERHMTILEKFNVPEWVDAVKRRRPHYVSGPPAVIRMIYDANVPVEDLSSIKYFWGGAGHLPADLHDAFEARYNLDIIWAMGATEFCGTILAWTPKLKKEFWTSKRGSIGRAFAGAEVRIVDQQTGEVLPPGQVGYIEGLVPAVSPNWIRTTDLALMDEDGFFFHKGRGDGAISRGGFKVLPEKVAEGIASHPSVLDVGVVAAPDQRLGQVPVAYVELRRDAEPTDEQALLAHARKNLIKTHIPVRIVILDALPRTPSLKVSLGELQRRAAADVAATVPA